MNLDTDIDLDPTKEIVVAPYNRCFGDCWAVLNHAIRRSILRKKTVWVSDCVCAGAHMVPGLPSRGEYVGSLVQEQLDELATPSTADVKVASKVVLEPRKITVEEFVHPYYPAKHRWKFGPYGRICIQTDNSQTPENCARSFKRHEREALYKWLEGKNYVILGKPMSTSQCAEIATTSDVFIGMDSGMSHLCHSVGIPMLLLDWVALDRFHPKKVFYKFSKVAEAIKIAEDLSRDCSAWVEMVKRAEEASEPSP